jgi:hypothetical protein
LARRNNHPSEDRYTVTHAFELKTAETLGTFAEQLRQHAIQIASINQTLTGVGGKVEAFSEENQRAHDTIQASIKDVGTQIAAIKNPSFNISLKGIAKVVMAVMGSTAGAAIIWETVRRVAETLGWLGGGP